MGETLPIYFPEEEKEKYTEQAEAAGQSHGGWCRDRLRAGVLLWETGAFDRDALDAAIGGDEDSTRRTGGSSGVGGGETSAMAERVHANLGINEYTTIDELTELLFDQLEAEVADALKQLSDDDRIEHHPAKGYRRES